mmetsp:Transcript_24395/g.35832  ORF Transcript_24395/g.35832 Transcript_24395/m.35832 type:complete len:1001 (-) Transcript_24395:240-3242(-)|eukprot:CAMPEP_0185030744 /NCGR_PEP_ID=MMETSP1103-20130426/17783_1 /TAXON_ID=36769 /ORGANISM="Paraphysomonas bandaiensis, Strain Caron Lab Isolate" /LENGTH=1000 /DNA_ID=CAMNT_0027565979 /DNA_START=76 /DNA_END=3078 /DNA_ORIENTATION=+
MSHVYNIDLAFTDNSSSSDDSVQIRRSLEAIEVLLSSLTIKLPDTLSNTADIINRCSQTLQTGPAPDTDRVGDDCGVPSAEQVEDLLKFCLKEGEIVRSRSMEDFMWESVGGADSAQNESSTLSAVDFILQPFESQTVYIPRCKQFFIDFKIDKGCTLVWRFSVGCGCDVDFCALFRESLFCKFKRRTSDDSASGNSASTSPVEVKPADGTSVKIMDDVSARLFDGLMERGLKSAEELVRTPEFKTVQLVTPPKKVKGPPLSGSFTADRSGVYRMVWDNSFSAFTGKHIEYCAQCVGEGTMQAALKAADDLQEAQSRPRSTLYRRLLECAGVSVSVDGPWKEPTANVSPTPTGEYLDSMGSLDHHRVVSESAGLEEDEGDVVLGQGKHLVTEEKEDGQVARPQHNPGWTSYGGALGAVYGIGPYAGGALLSLGHTTGLAGYNAIGGIVGGVVQTPITISKQVASVVGGFYPHQQPPSGDSEGDISMTAMDPPLHPSAPRIGEETSESANRGKGAPASGSWLYPSSLGAYLPLRWSTQATPPSNEAQISSRCEVCGSGGLKDVLGLAQRVDALEDDVGVVEAQRDQARAELQIVRTHLEAAEREQQGLLNAREEAEALTTRITSDLTRLQEACDKLRNSSEQAARQHATEVEELEGRCRELEAEKRGLALKVEAMKKEAGVWSAARGAVQEELARVSASYERDAAVLAEAVKEKEEWVTERRDLCGRIADLEAENSRLLEQLQDRVEDSDGTASDKEGELAAALADRDECRVALSDYAHRLDELQSQLVLLRAQRRIDEREFRRVQRECAQAVQSAKAEASESRMMQVHYQEKLTRVKAERKVLLQELRALRDLGLYEGPLTVDSKASAAPQHPTEKDSARTSPMTVEKETVKDDGDLKNEQEETEGDSEGDEYLRGYCGAVLQELRERRAMVSQMMKADPGSRALQQLALQLDTQTQNLMARSELPNSSTPVVSRPGGTSPAVPSHDEWLESSFREWNEV